MKKLSLVLVITLLSLCCLVAGCNTPCMHSYTTQEGPNYIVITPPTSTTAGVAQQSCLNCGYIQNVAIPATGQPVQHACTYKCPTCQKCTNTQCTENVCADKCLGHVPPHTCEHKCVICQKCTDTQCTEDVCADKCLGHQPPHTCTYMCPICDKCTNTQCTEDVCADKCLGHNQTPPTHTCESVCDTCGKCTDASCTEEICSNKCQGHTITPPAHSCTSICSTCGKCTDQSCAEAVCTDKCQGHSTTPSQSLIATFNGAEGKQLYTDNSNLTFTASIAPYGYDAQKAGVQFTQNSGTAVVTSDQTLTGVTSITVKVQTNQTSGMTVVVKVGSTTFTTSNNKVIKDDGITDIVFTSSTAASGKLSITLEPTSSSKSMYLMAVTVNGASGGQGSEGGTSTNVMPQQQYNANNFDDRNLQELMTSFEFSDGTVGESIGLLSEGTYNALVIPVAFSNYSFTQQELANLNIAFNGTEAQTGWESVKTYYQQSSYGKLNITFDITDVFTAANSAAYYDYSNDNTSGSEQLLLEALEHFDGKIDYSKYDVDNDGCIDAVYLIYAAPVDYESDSEYWAFVTWSYAENQFDQLYPYYYLFAGKDFMLEGTSASKYPDDEILEGMIVNASTYIHETGHLLSLDDYYDYDESAGSNQGLGCADMMDSTVGDHSSYSKIMLGWLTPTIVTQSGTYTIDALSQNASCLLIPLDFNNSYFCEYLLVDLYADSGLNDLHGGFEGSLLYDIAEYGVRIYHVSNWVTNPYENEYGSYTDNNNTSSDTALIRLVEADGTIGFSDTVEMYDYQFAMDYDLWQAGDSLLKVFPSFARYDNKLVNFDITIDSVSMDQATVTVTFNN